MALQGLRDTLSVKMASRSIRNRARRGGYYRPKYGRNYRGETRRSSRRKRYYK